MEEPKGNRSIHKSIAINSGSNALRLFVSIAIPFVMTPFYLRVLGDSIYGIWVVVLSFIGQMGLLEMGVQPAIIKMVAEHNAVRDVRKVNGILVTSLVFYLIVGVIVIMTCWLVGSFAIHYFVFDQKQLGLGKVILILCGIDFALKLITYVFGGMLLGIQKFHVKNFINIILMMVTAFAIYAFLSVGHGIIVLLSITIASDLVTIIALFIAGKRTYPSLQLKLSTIDRSSFRRLFGFAGKVFTSSGLSRIAYNADPIIISYFLSPVWATVFSIPQRLVRYIKEIIWSLTAVFLPIFSDLDSKSDTMALKSVYLRYSRYILIIMLPLLAALSVYGVTFISVWVGEGYAQKGQMVLFLLIACVFAELLQPLDRRLFIGTNNLNVMVKLSAVASALNIALSLFLVQYYGINGIALATLTTTVVLRVLFLILTSGYYKVRIREYIYSSVGLPLVCAATYGAAMCFIKIQFGCASYSEIVLQVVACFPLYVITVWPLSLNKYERAYAVQKMRRFLAVLRRLRFRDLLNAKQSSNSRVKMP